MMIIIMMMMMMMIMMMIIIMIMMMIMIIIIIIIMSITRESRSYWTDKEIFLIFDGTRRFIIAFTISPLWKISQTRYSFHVLKPCSPKCTFNIVSHLRFNLWSGIFSRDFQIIIIIIIIIIIATVIDVVTGTHSLVDYKINILGS